jgi:hypothetical protein
MGVAPVVDGQVAWHALPHVSLGVFGAYAYAHTSGEADYLCLASPTSMFDNRVSFIDAGARVLFHAGRLFFGLGVGTEWKHYAHQDDTQTTRATASDTLAELAVGYTFTQLPPCAHCAVQLVGSIDYSGELGGPSGCGVEVARYDEQVGPTMSYRLAIGVQFR